MAGIATGVVVGIILALSIAAVVLCIKYKKPICQRFKKVNNSSNNLWYLFACVVGTNGNVIWTQTGTSNERDTELSDTQTALR